jgi:lipoyl(octanoyl) transferase
MHGFSLNADVDLAWYDRFVPCGISDAGVTSLSVELGRDVTVPEVAGAVAPHLADLLAWRPYTPSPDVEHVEPEGVLSVPIGNVGLRL